VRSPLLNTHRPVLGGIELERSASAGGHTGFPDALLINPVTA